MICSVMIVFYDSSPLLASVFKFLTGLWAGGSFSGDCLQQILLLESWGRRE